MGVAGGDGFDAAGVQRAHRGELTFGAAHREVGDGAICGYHQLVAEQRRPAELLHEGLGELFESVGDDDDLGEAAQLVQKRAGAGHGVDLGDDRLHVGQAQPMLGQNVEAPLHEFVVVGLVAGGALKLGDAGFLGEGDPDFGNQHAFQIEAYDVHRALLPWAAPGLKACAPQGFVGRSVPH